MPLSDAESRLLWSLGVKYVHSATVVSIFCFAYGIFVILFWTSAARLRRRGRTGLATRVMFCATVINFLLFTMEVGTEVAELVVFVRTALVETVNVPLVQRRKITNDALLPMNLIGNWPESFILFIGDLVVIWRAWVLFQNKKWTLILPCILWLGTMGTQLAYSILFLTSGDIPTVINEGRYLILPNISFVLSIATNAVTTLLIAYRLWSYRAFLVKDLGLSSRTLSPAQKTLILLVESGIAYCGLQATRFALGLREPNDATFVFAAIFPAISAMYPTIVMVLVSSQRSMADMYDFDTK